MSRAALALVTLAACGDNTTGLDNYYPKLPPTGGAQNVFAGEVTEPSQLVTGPAQSGLVGDFFMKNDRVTFIIQAPTRVIGVIPQGGNVVDAVLTDGTHQLTDDHFGELGLIYLLGRTCEPDRIEIVRDGSQGGAAVLRAIGKSGNDDFINIKGIGIIPVDATIDPDTDDGIECATTYILPPGSTTLAVYHSLYNAGKDSISGPMGTIADTGGATDAWTNTRGFELANSLSDVAALGQPHPSDYVVYQGPGVAYGIIPRHAVPTEHTHASISGVSILLDGNSSLLDILHKDRYFLHLAPGQGVLQQYDLVVARDASGIDAVWRSGETLTPISGHVAFDGGAPAVGARVGVFADDNGNGALDDTDHALFYMDVAPDGTYSGQLPAGNLFVRAEVKNVGRSQVVPAAASVNLTVPSPIQVDYQILDADTGASIPGRLLVVGDHPAFPDARVFERFDRIGGVVTQVHALEAGTLALPAGGNYRIYASRGTEWTVDSAPVTASGSITFHLKHVLPTPGYYATDWHVHQVGSPDSNILSDERIRSAVSQGVEMFAVTDHDYVSDLEPLVQQMGLDHLLRVLPGIEVTPFPYGHFNAWPLTPDNSSANHGAIDWARGAASGMAMAPGEIFAAMKSRGAQMVQVNHPRATGFGEFQAAFSRANLQFDYTNRTIYGDYMNADVPNDWLRLPDESLWSDQFTGLEIWNGFNIVDTNGDGLRENKSLDTVMRDWLSMLSLGLYVTPAGDSDTHTTVSDPLGMPRTYVRVSDDSPDALANGSAIDEVVATQTGAGGVPRDVVITDGPMIDVRYNGLPALGSVIPTATLTVAIASADWAPFDTLEIFANATPGPLGQNDSSALVPLKCYTSRPLASLAPNDPCMQAALAPEAMTVTLANQRYDATVQITLDAADIPTRAGATGKDAWLVFRARGDRGIFPILAKGDTISDATMPALLSGDSAQLDAALAGHGVPAEAVTAPVFVDFDGGGYRAPFAP